jgi:hypothetical protein
MGDFSRDTFKLNKMKNYVGVRLQQGVPILDSDWNEMEDIRKEELRTFIKDFVGSGVPRGPHDFSIMEAAENKNNFTIAGGTPEAPGKCLANGWEIFIYNSVDYIQQKLYRDEALALHWGVAPLNPLSSPGADERNDCVYLDIWEREVDRTEDDDMVDPDVGIETSVRLKREWVVRVAEGTGALPPPPAGHVFYHIATLNRKAEDGAIKAENITDKRLKALNMQAIREFLDSDETITSAKIKPADGVTQQDVTTGSGVKAGHIQDSAVTTGKISDSAVTTEKLNNNAVSGLKIQDNAITTRKILDDSITKEKLQMESVTEGKIISGAVTNAKIKNGAISEEKLNDDLKARLGFIPDGTITEEKLLDGIVTELKLRDGAVSEVKLNDDLKAKLGAIADASITEGKIQDNAVTENKIREGAVSTQKIQNGAISTQKIGNNTITTSKLQNNAVNTQKIQNGAVTVDKIQNGAVTIEKLNTPLKNTLTEITTSDHKVGIGTKSPAAPLDVNGTIRGKSFINVPETFKVGGEYDRSYAVIFTNMDSAYGPASMELSRRNVHEDGDFRGTMWFKITWQGPEAGNCGLHSYYYYYDHFRGIFIKDIKIPWEGNHLILWLRGDSTYTFRRLTNRIGYEILDKGQSKPNLHTGFDEGVIDVTPIALGAGRRYDGMQLGHHWRRYTLNWNL